MLKTRAKYSHMFHPIIFVKMILWLEENGFAKTHASLVFQKYCGNEVKLQYKGNLRIHRSWSRSWRVNFLLNYLVSYEFVIHLCSNPTFLMDALGCRLLPPKCFLSLFFIVLRVNNYTKRICTVIGCSWVGFTKSAICKVTFT